MTQFKKYDEFLNESSKFPEEIEGNDQIIFKKEWEKMNGGKLAAKYNMYYRGYEIDGNRIFGSVPELERFMKNYILSNNLYAKYKYMPEKPIGESVVNEGKYDFMSGLSIQFNGTNYSISSVKDDLVNVKDSKNNEKTFRLSAIVAQNPGVDVKPRMPRPSAWNKGMKSDAYSKSEYQKILKDAIKDAGGSEYAHDMAQSMIYDPGIRARIEKDYPMLRNINQMIQRLQWDLEMY